MKNRIKSVQKERGYVLKEGANTALNESLKQSIDLICAAANHLNDFHKDMIKNVDRRTSGPEITYIIDTCMLLLDHYNNLEDLNRDFKVPLKAISMVDVLHRHPGIKVDPTPGVPTFKEAVSYYKRKLERILHWYKEYEEDKEDNDND